MLVMEEVIVAFPFSEAGKDRFPPYDVKHHNKMFMRLWFNLQPLQGKHFDEAN